MFQVGKPIQPPPHSHHPPPAALGGGGRVLKGLCFLQSGDPGQVPACLWLPLCLSFPDNGTKVSGPQAAMRIL